MRPLNQVAHRFKRMCGTITFTGNAAFAPWTTGYANYFSDLINAAEFTALYDQYKITYVVHKVWLSVDPSAQTAATAVYPRVFWVVDHDDSSIPASIDELRQDGRCKTAVLTPARCISIGYKPSTLQLVYQSAVASQYSPRYNVWLDTAGADNSLTSVPHFGLKMAMDNLTNTNYRINIERTLYFSCKNSR